MNKRFFKAYFIYGSDFLFFALFDLGFIKRVLEVSKKGRIATLSSSLAYYMMFALFPTLVMFFTLTDPFVSFFEAGEEIYSILPEEFASLLNFARTRQAALTVTSGIFVSLFSFIKFVRSLKNHLCEIYGTRDRFSFFTSWVFSGVMALYALAMLYLALFVIMFGERLIRGVVEFFGFEDLFDFVRDKLALLIIVLLAGAFVLLVFMFLSGERRKVKEVLPGTVFTLLGWILSTFAFSYYVEFFSNKAFFYGPFGTVIILMTWLYILSLILLTGANINLVFSKKETL